MNTEEKNELAKKLTEIEDLASSMWHEALYAEEDEMFPFDFDKANDTIAANIKFIRKKLDIPQPPIE